MNRIQTDRLGTAIILLHLTLGISLTLFSGCSSGSSLSVSGTGGIVPSFDDFPLFVYTVSDGSSKSNTAEEPPRALLFYIQGSDYATAMNENTMGSFASATALGSKVIVVEKRGVRPDTVLLDTCYFYSDKETWVKDHLTVIESILDQSAPNVPVILMGASEGGDVAAAVAAREKRITHLILLGSGGGWSQEKEFRYFIRTSPPYIGLRTERELDSVVAVIKSRPNSTELWAGHPFKRWSSYMFDPPINSLIGLDIPIFLVQGDQDRNVPVGSARAVKEAFDKAGKHNLTYREYAGADHQMMSRAKGISLYPRLEVDLIDWLVVQGLLPAKEAAVFTSRVRKAHTDVFEE